jgi:hypothetical protein
MLYGTRFIFLLAQFFSDPETNAEVFLTLVIKLAGAKAKAGGTRAGVREGA